MRVWLRLRNDPVGMVCLCFLLAVAALALCAPLAAPWDPTAIDVRNKFAAWSLAHPLGTDQLGRDVLSRLIWGGRATLGFSLLTMGITLVIGSGLGIVA
ncbi:MAG: nickel ABC transporter permease subunit NikC, partial [Desulfovibrio desulfuricans]|nr:nickel ABC transporter permease subunit NikC [Desulfovibrio desulfuricans]